MITQEHLTFLDELRENGKTNMLGAGIYLERRFPLAKRQAKEVLDYWRENFNIEGTTLKEGER